MVGMTCGGDGPQAYSTGTLFRKERNGQGSQGRIRYRATAPLYRNAMSPTPCLSVCAVRSAARGPPACATRDPKRARRLLEGRAARLEHQHPGAAASLREGLEETLTVMRLGLPENLERVRSSTNLIENLLSRVRAIGRRVKRWPNGTMVLRWTAAGVLEAERGFRKLIGYRARCRSGSPYVAPTMRSVIVQSARLTILRSLVK
jgi:hypothetical protein